MVGLVCKRIVQLTNVPVPCNYSWPMIALPESSIHYSYTEDFFPELRAGRKRQAYGQGYVGISSAGSRWFSLEHRLGSGHRGLVGELREPVGSLLQLGAQPSLLEEGLSHLGRCAVPPDWVPLH